MFTKKTVFPDVGEIIGSWESHFEREGGNIRSNFQDEQKFLFVLFLFLKVR